MIFLEVVFIFSFALIGYACLGYPLLIFMLSRLCERPVRKADISHKVSVIIAAYNERRDIASTIESALALDYPSGKLEVIVASDCSTDGTDEIVRSYADRGVILHRQVARLGKTMAQNSAVEISSGEILVFTDATTRCQKDSVRKLVRCFADPEVGCVSSRLVYADRSQTAIGLGCKSYWGYEEFIRESESRLGSLIGVTGCLYAVRRTSYSPLDHDMCSDFVIASEIYLKGLRTVNEMEAIAIEDTNNRSRDEFRMRVRIMEQTMNALSHYRDVLSLSRHGLFAFQMLSHKVLRYAVSMLLVVVLLSNFMIVDSSEIYQATLALQLAFYASALAGWILSRFGRRIGPLALPYYFVLANAAIIVAFVKHIRGEAYVVWEPLREATNRANARSATGG